ncbi:unnamed protein product [Trichobilharzia regenti]|nr:unnamed protein product [Trichobilharzia regenti]
MQLVVHRGKHASFAIAVTFAFLAAISNIIGFVSPYWIVSKSDSNIGFQRLGLWEVCFENFIFPEDYVSKAYQGCWYIYYPEYKYIRFWLNPPWFYVVQILSIICLICNLAGLLMIILILCEVYGTKERKPHFIIIGLQSIALACFVIITIYMGVMSKDRGWLPRPDLNMLSWSFAFAVLAGFFTVFCLFGLVTHYLSVESKRLMQDPIMRQKLLGSEGYYKSQRQLSHYDVTEKGGVGAPTESKLGGTGTVPSLFTTVPSTFAGYQPGSQTGPTSTLMAPGMSSILSRSTIAPGAVGGNAAGTSAATVSAKLRESLEAQRIAVLEANLRAAENELTQKAENVYAPTSAQSLYMPNIKTESRYDGTMPRQARPHSSVSHLQSNVAMDSAV